jgi:hypothetical protein
MMHINLPPSLPFVTPIVPLQEPFEPKREAPQEVLAQIPFKLTIDQSGILFLGLNANAYFEAHALESVGLPLQRILHQDTPTVSLEEQSFDLTIEAEVQDFIQSLGFDGAQSIALADALWGLDFALRDEVARLIQVWSRAELHQEDIPTRLVLSGHSGGRFFWGIGDRPQEFSGNLELKDLRRITALLPKAVSQIRSIFLAGCNTGWEENLRQMAALFPQAQSLTGYTDSAPLASEEAPAEILHWAQWTFLDEASLQPFAPNMAVLHPPLERYQQEQPAGERPATLVALDEDPAWRRDKRQEIFTKDLSEIADPFAAEVLRGVMETSLRLLADIRSGDRLVESEAEILANLQESIQEVLADPGIPDRYHPDLTALEVKLEHLRNWSQLMATLDQELKTEGVQLEVNLSTLNYGEFQTFVEALSQPGEDPIPSEVRHRLRNLMI